MMSDLFPVWAIFLATVIVVFWGLVLGSFTTCVVYRVPRKLSIWKNDSGSYRSFCPQCKASLQTKDLVPILSWLLQKGRCRYCKLHIPTYYLWIEIAVLAFVSLIFWALGVNAWSFVISLVIPGLAGLVSFLMFRRGI